MTDLEHALADLAAHLDEPRPEGLAQRVAARLELVPQRRGRRVGWRTWLAAVAVFLAPTVLLSDAIADRLGFGGVEVRQAPLPPPTQVGEDLDLGRAVTLADAQRAVDFPVATSPDLGDAEVWLDERGDVAAVTLVWGEDTLLTQLRGTVDYLRKLLGQANVEEVSVGGDAGLWISGPPHVVFHVDEQGAFHEDRTRLAANVLLWSSNRVTYRLETRADRDTALAIARNLRPVRGVTST